MGSFGAAIRQSILERIGGGFWLPFWSQSDPKLVSTFEATRLLAIRRPQGSHLGTFWPPGAECATLAKLAPR